jgi:hypothetical protein
MRKQRAFGEKPLSSGGQVPSQNTLSPLWTRKQVADALGLCVHSVARYTRAGLLPCIKLNRRVVRYDPGAVRAFIRSAQEGVR